jgi:hypothetical protein
MDNGEIIQRPPRIYLDTNHLINIARVRKGEEPQPAWSKDNYCYILWADNSLESKVFSDTGDFLNALKNQGFTW